MAALAEARFDLRVRSTCSGGVLSPRAAVLQAARRGLAGLALADVGTVDGLPAAWAAACELGLLLIPAVELVTRQARYVAYGIDPGAPVLRRLLARLRAGDSVTPAMCLYAVQRAGGVALHLGGRAGADPDWHRAPWAVVARLEQEAGQPGLMARLQARMAWRWRNLTAAEYQASFTPTPLRIRTLHLRGLMTRPPCPPAPRRATAAAPFVLVRPAAVRRTDAIAAWLAARGVTVRHVAPVPRFAELAWDLLRRETDGADAALRNLLLLEADLRRHGPGALTGAVLQLRDWAGHEPRALKQALRRHLGPIAFTRVQYRGHAETGFDAFVHLPDPEAAAREQAILAHHGIAVTPRAARRPGR